MRKIFAIILTAVILLTLVSCGGKKKPSGDNGNSTVSNSDPSGQGKVDEAEIENLVELSLDKAQYEKEERIEVMLDFDKLNQDEAVIAIVDFEMEHGKETPAHDNYEEYRYLSDFSELPFYLWAPARDGLFDVRVYANSEGGKELASALIAVGSAVLPMSGEGLDSEFDASVGAPTQGGDNAQKQMEDTIVSYFSPISELSALTLCGGDSIECEPADIPWQTVDIWTINSPTIEYDELAAAMSSQLTAAGLSEREMESGGYEWSVAIGEKKMYIQLRAYYEGDGYYLIYATPEAE